MVRRPTGCRHALSELRQGHPLGFSDRSETSPEVDIQFPFWGMDHIFRLSHPPHPATVVDMSEPLDQRIARNLRLLRKQQGLTQQEVTDRARAAGFTITRDGVSKMERGHRPCGLKADALAAGLGVDVESLVTGRLPIDE